MLIVKLDEEEVKKMLAGVSGEVHVSEYDDGMSDSDLLAMVRELQSANADLRDGFPEPCLRAGLDAGELGQMRQLRQERQEVDAAFMEYSNAECGEAEEMQLRDHLCEELQDEITAATTMLMLLGLDFAKCRKLAKRVNKKNRDRGYID